MEPAFYSGQDTRIICPVCKAPNPDDNLKCSKCGRLLPETPRRGDKNDAANLAYKLALFSFIPGIGVFLGFPAIILANKGIRFAAQHPKGEGKWRAYGSAVLGLIGIICGFLWWILPAF